MQKTNSYCIPINKVKIILNLSIRILNVKQLCMLDFMHALI